jgi:hypothetical protein
MSFFLSTEFEFLSRRAMGLDSPGSIPDSVKFFQLHSVQTDTEVHPASYPMGTGDPFPGVKRQGRDVDH